MVVARWEGQLDSERMNAVLRGDAGDALDEADAVNDQRGDVVASSR
jgi:hypothetical protein